MLPTGSGLRHPPERVLLEQRVILFPSSHTQFSQKRQPRPMTPTGGLPTHAPTLLAVSCSPRSERTLRVLKWVKGSSQPRRPCVCQSRVVRRSERPRGP